MNHPALRAVSKLCERWGVEFHARTHGDDSSEIAAEEEGKFYASGPGNADLIWPEGPVVVRLNSLSYETGPSGVEAAWNAVHELGHVLIGGNPSAHDEVEGPGLALDRAHCKVLRLPWVDGLMADFVVNSGGTWPEESTQERGRLLAASQKVAIRWGLLTPDGKPSFNLKKRFKMRYRK